MYFDYFVLPFTIGLSGLLIYLIFQYVQWIRSFSRHKRLLILKNMFTVKTLKAIGEIFMESLVHHRIFRTNPFLGYMHMCFGLGWFLLIISGKIESMVYHTNMFNPPYFAIFFRFFHPAQETFPLCDFFAFFTDLILLFILSGLLLAMLKRLYSRIVGLKKTTNHRPMDLLILYTLWSIFPLRFLAESFTSGLRGGGSFLTHSSGEFFASFLPIEYLAYPAWWAYSLALGTFFCLLPLSRYMHIPTEMVYIFMKNWGLAQGKKINAFTNVELYSCSRCGICLDRCQLGNTLDIKGVQPVYFLKYIRHHKPFAESASNCMMCGRCEEACPVNIEINAIRQAARPDTSCITKDTYSYIRTSEVKMGKVAYFAGCMGHLTPNVIKSMRHIFEKAHVDYSFVDENGGVCCGRPMLLSGNRSIASVLFEKNKQIFENTEAEILVTTCPICYKTFKENYRLNMKVMHHTEFIEMLMKSGQLVIHESEQTTVFHNPCELGRGSNVTSAPNFILEQVSHKIATRYDDKESLCCGGSLATMELSAMQRNKISRDAIDAYLAYKPDVIVTACPQCKKTFAKQSEKPVKDIAEIVAENC